MYWYTKVLVLLLNFHVKSFTKLIEIKSFNHNTLLHDQDNPFFIIPSIYLKQFNLFFILFIKTRI